MTSSKTILLIAFVSTWAYSNETNGLKIGAAGWIQSSKFMAPETTYVKGIDKLSQYTYGSQLSLTKSINPDLEIYAGMGILASHFLAYSNNNGGGYAPIYYAPFPTQAYVKYSFLNQEFSKLSVKFGLFPYDYAENSRNFGLYLLRGPVYPGYLLSGFETKHVLPIANMAGINLHHETKNFSEDFILNSETEFFPYYDLSPAFLVFYKAPTLKIGLGVNFYHAWAIDDSLTTNHADFFVDSSSGKPDTTFLSFKGTKLMSTITLDPKNFWGSNEVSEDWKIYAEIALIGIKNSKAYRELYGDYIHRMPIMGGFNAPTFGLLDVLSFEVEWYGAPFFDDISKYTSHTSGRQDPLPSNPEPGKNYKRDNWKWSVYTSKMFLEHIKVSGQAASDHSRPGSFKEYGDNAPPDMKSPFTSLRNWYFSGKLAYFF